MRILKDERKHAIMIKIMTYFLAAFSSLFFLAQVAVAQHTSDPQQMLTEKQRAIILISSFTAKGDLPKLKQALNTGLDAGLTVNESKEVLVHLYAYCGFPRSIQGLNTLMALLNERKAKGINDNMGREASPINNTTSKYDAGWKNLAKLGGRPTDGPIEKPTSGYGAFSPEMDTFLKEHLFADIFSRDVLSFSERELTTVSALISLGGVEPMLSSHLSLAMIQGVSKVQLEEVMALVEKLVSKTDAEAARKVLLAVTSRN